MIESRLLADQSLHAAHGWGKLRILDVQVHIRRELTRVTVGAQIIGPRHAHLAYGTENWLGAQFHVMCLMAADTSQAALIR